MGRKYDLVGIDGNAFSIIGYVVNAMRTERCSKDKIEEYKNEAMSGDYNNLLLTSVDVIDELNERYESDKE